MKSKLFSILFLSLFLISFASAFDFDNTYEYNPITKTAYIHNCDFWIGTCFSQGEVLAEATLTWGDTQVPRGIDTHVGTFTYTPQSASSSIQDLDLTDLKSGEVMTRGKQYKVKEIFNETYDDYTQVCDSNTTVINDTYVTECSDVWNETNQSYYEVCSEVFNGTQEITIPVCHEELIEDLIREVVEWKPLNSWLNKNDFVIGQEYTIGVFVDVEKDDYGDWLPTFAGVTVEEWASFEENGLVGLEAYYPLDYGSGSVIDLSMTGHEGVIGNAFSLAKDSDYFESTYDFTSDFGAGDFSIGFWVKFNEMETGRRLVYQVHSGTNRGLYLSTDATNADELQLYLFGASGSPSYTTSSADLTTDTWYYIVVKRDSGTNYIYINDVQELNSADTAGNLANVASAENFVFGIDRSYNPILAVNASFDEPAIWDKALSGAEMTSLYNSGAGKAYTDLTAGEKTNLISYYSLDDLTQPIDSTNSVTGLVGNALDVSGGVSDYVDLGTNILPASTTDYTVCVWVYPNSKGADDNFIDQNNGAVGRWGLGASGTTNYYPYVFYNDGATKKPTATTALNTGEWALVCATRDSNTLGIWVNDGAVEDTETVSGNTEVTNTLIGSNALNFDGYLDEVMIWVGTALDQTAIESIYNSGNGKSYADLTAGEKTNLVAYYSLDEVLTQPEDSVERYKALASWSGTMKSGYEGTNSGSTRGVDGVLYSGFSMSGSDTDKVTSTAIDFVSSSTDPFAVNLWFNSSGSFATNEYLLFGGDGYTNFHLYTPGTGSIRFRLRATGTDDHDYTVSPDNNYHMLTMVYDGDRKIGYYDGTEVVNASVGALNTPDDQGLVIGNYYSGSYSFGGTIDEVSIFKRTLSGEEITELYNSGNALAYNFDVTPADNPPVITSPLPANDTTYTTTTQVNFNWTVSDDINLVNTSIYIDGVLENTNSSGFNNTLYFYSKSLASGIHNWSLIAFDNASQSTTAGPYFVNISISTPTVTLQSPADNVFVNNITQELIGYVESDLTVANVSLYVNGSLIETNSSGLNSTNYSFTHTFSAGASTWYFKACNNLGFCADSSTRTLNEDLDNVTINTTLLTPIIYAFGDNVSINFTATDSFLDSCWYDYPNIKANSISNVSSVASDFNYNTSATDTGEVYMNFTSVTVGDILNSKWYRQGSGGVGTPIVFYYYFYAWNYTSSDWEAFRSYYQGNTISSYGNLSIQQDILPSDFISGGLVQLKIQDSEASFYDFNIQSPGNLSCTSGVEQTVNITSVEGSTNITFYANHSVGEVFSDTVTFAYDPTVPNATIVAPALFGDYGYDGQNTTFNYSVQDVNLDSCWYNYNGTNVTTPCTSGFYNTTYFTLIEGNSNLTLYANDTVGNLMSEFYEWDYKVFQGPQVYSATARSGNLETYYTNVTMGTGYELASSSLVYEGEYTTPTIFSTGQLRALTAEYVPLTTVDVNNTFFWNLVLTDGTEINSTNQTQLVTAIYLDDCSNYTFELFNLSLVDEELQTALNGTIELGFTLQNKPYYDSVNTRYIKLEGVNTTRVCSDVNLTNENLAFSAEIRYFATDYAAELYHIQRADLEGEVYNITLYDLNDNDSTEFKITYQDSNFNFVDDAIIQLQRKYIDEGVYKVVEAPLTSADGVAVVHIDLNSIKYKATVVKNGEVLNTFDNIVFVCASELTGECTQALLGEVDSINEKSVNTERDFSYSVTRVNNTVTIPFTIPSTVASSVNIVLTQQDQFGNTTICNKTVISSAGSIDCTFNDSIGDSYLTLQIYKNGIPMAYTTYIIPESGVVDFLGNNYIIVVLLMLSLVGLALTSPEWMIINGIVTFFVAGALWLVSGTNFVAGLGLMLWLVIAAGIIIFKLAKQDDR